MRGAKLRNWQRMKCEIKMRKLISLSNHLPKTDVVYSMNENAKPVINNWLCVSCNIFSHFVSKWLFLTKKNFKPCLATMSYWSRWHLVSLVNWSIAGESQLNCNLVIAGIISIVVILFTFILCLSCSGREDKPVRNWRVYNLVVLCWWQCVKLSVLTLNKNLLVIYYQYSFCHLDLLNGSHSHYSIYMLYWLGDRKPVIWPAKTLLSRVLSW